MTSEPQPSMLSGPPPRSAPQRSAAAAAAANTASDTDSLMERFVSEAHIIHSATADATLELKLFQGHTIL